MLQRTLSHAPPGGVFSLRTLDAARFHAWCLLELGRRVGVVGGWVHLAVCLFYTNVSHNIYNIYLTIVLGVTIDSLHAVNGFTGKVMRTCGVNLVR